jgi:transglutaminase-like putative cysteine protease
VDASAEAFQQQKLVRHENLMWLIVAQGIVILPLLARLPVWLWLVWFSAMLWRLRIHSGKMVFPSGTIKLALGLGCVLGLFLSYQRSLGIEPMVGFLVCAFVLKLLELRTRKDGLLLLFIGFIAVATQFLFSQSFASALYAWLSCVALITAWQTIYLTRHYSTFFKIKSGVILLVHAMPLMLLMFVIMPRLGPLWRVPVLQGGGHTGFSDSMAPGDLGQLVKSTGTAFRVTFNGSQTPPPREMYWRGLVLDNFDGRTWSLDNDWDSQFSVNKENVQLDDLLDYDIIMEPHKYRWLFALAEPVTVSTERAAIRISYDGLIVARDTLVSRLQYTVVSVSPDKFTWPDLTPFERARLQRLPTDYNPESIALARGWTAQGLTPKGIIEKALDWYNQAFFYTLAPPTLGKHSVDEFLFNTKRGFCEHFASSFVVLMRAAGLPARVVVGYQGGTYNGLEDYWIVSQADAHAWAEVWIDGEGWQRVDPTSAVAPQRIEQGIVNALPPGERKLVGAGNLESPQWLIHLRHRMDAAGYVWNRWVLSYDAEKQNRLLTQLLGGIEPWRIGVGFCALIGGLLGLYTLLVIKPRWRTKTPFERALLRFDRSCQQLGVSRQQDESLAAFAQRLAAAKPKLKKACHRLAQISQRALYAGDPRCTDALLRALKQFPKDN